MSSKTILTLTEVERELNELKSKRGRKSKTTLERIEYLQNVAKGLTQPKKEIKLSSSMRISLYNSRQSKGGELKQTDLPATKWEEVMIRESKLPEEKKPLLRRVLYALYLIEAKENATKEKIFKVAKAVEVLEEKGDLNPDFGLRLRLTLRDYWKRAEK